MKAEKETLSVKVDPDIKDRLKILQNNFSGDGNDFYKELLYLYENNEVDTNTDSPVKNEKLKIKKKINDLERFLNSFLEIAGSENASVKEEAAKKIAEVELEYDVLKDKYNKLKGELERIRTISQQHSQEVITCRESAETLSELKAAWEKEKTTMETRIAEFDAEMKEVRTLKKDLKDKEIQVEVANYKIENQKEMIGALNKLHQECREALHDFVTKK